MISLQDAVDDLYRIAVVERATQSPRRLELLADMCIEQLDQRGISGVEKEVRVRGHARTKQWDTAWPVEGKVRLGISLKSVLANIAGTVPNRIDDLMGEMANLQLRSPEIVTGYIMIIDATKNGDGYRKDGMRWVDFFRNAVNNLTGRTEPSWTVGTVEASAVV